VWGLAAPLPDATCRDERMQQPLPALHCNMRPPACQGASSGYGFEHGRGRPIVPRQAGSLVLPDRLATLAHALLVDSQPPASVWLEAGFSTLASVWSLVRR